MIKVEHNIFYKTGIVAFAFEASNDRDIETLDLLFEALNSKPEVKAAYLTSRRLVAHFSGMREDLFKNPDGSLIKNI